LDLYPGVYFWPHAVILVETIAECLFHLKKRADQRVVILV
jgi:hypothetical protein